MGDGDLAQARQPQHRAHLRGQAGRQLGRPGRLVEDAVGGGAEPIQGGVQSAGHRVEDPVSDTSIRLAETELTFSRLAAAQLPIAVTVLAAGAKRALNCAGVSAACGEDTSALSAPALRGASTRVTFIGWGASAPRSCSAVTCQAAVPGVDAAAAKAGAIRSLPWRQRSPR